MEYLFINIVVIVILCLHFFFANRFMCTIFLDSTYMPLVFEFSMLSISVQFSSVQSLRRVRLFATP